MIYLSRNRFEEVRAELAAKRREQGLEPWVYTVGPIPEMQDWTPPQGTTHITFHFFRTPKRSRNAQYPVTSGTFWALHPRQNAQEMLNTLRS